MCETQSKLSDHFSYVVWEKRHSFCVCHIYDMLYKNFWVFTQHHFWSGSDVLGLLVILMMGHTSSPEMLVPDQTVTLGRN